MSSERPGTNRPKRPRPAGYAATKRAGALGILLAIGAGCASPNLETLLPLQPAPEPDKTGSLATPKAAYETAAIAPGTPTDVYTLVARGVLNCWFGVGGPLKASHVFQAEAEPPSKGGTAEIVIHERDVALRDQRGTRAYRISFATEASGVRVGMTALKFETKIAEAMAKDVEVWAKGGKGCQLRAVLPPPPPPAAKADKVSRKDKKR